MFEKVNPHHPDKIADRIAGAVVDLAYKKQKKPHIAVEVMIGHSVCFVIIETDVSISKSEVRDVVLRISPEYVKVKTKIVAQDMSLALNQTEGARCGDSGIFAGCLTTLEQKNLTDIAGKIYKKTYSDGKYLIDEHQEYFGEMTICQSNLNVVPHNVNLSNYMVLFNPLGNWTGGVNTDTGCTNRKLGSDMGSAALGGGLHGKDLSKADISLNIMCYLLAKKVRVTVYSKCSIADESVKFWCADKNMNKYLYKYRKMKFSDVIKIAQYYIKSIGGFEKFAEWGFIRPEYKINN